MQWMLIPKVLKNRAPSVSFVFWRLRVLLENNLHKVVGRKNVNLVCVPLIIVR